MLNRDRDGYVGKEDLRFGAERIGVDPRAFIAGLIGMAILAFLLGVWAATWIVTWGCTP